jgi:hypothetical protein
VHIDVKQMLLAFGAVGATVMLIEKVAKSVSAGLEERLCDCSCDCCKTANAWVSDLSGLIPQDKDREEKNPVEKAPAKKATVKKAV